MVTYGPFRDSVSDCHAQTCHVKSCGVLAAIAIGIALPIGAILLGALTRSLAPLLWALTAVVLIGLVAIGWSGLRFDLTRRKGILTPARVVETSEVHLGQIPDLYEIRYTYRDLNGVEHEGKSGYVHSIPLTTDEHFVRYDQSDPARSVWIS
jgi:hypothetical protein